MNLILSIIIIIATLITLNLSVKKEKKKCCLLDDSHLISELNLYLINNFDRLEDLNFQCNQTVDISFIELKPSKKIILNNSLNLNNLVIQPRKLGIFSVMFNNFKGFDIQQNPFENIKFINFNLNQTIWNVKNTYFDFYHKNQLITETNCNESMVLHKNSNFLTNSFVVVLHESVIFSKETCPFIFNSAYIILLSIKISSSFIKTNELNFRKLTPNSDYLITSVIFQLEIYSYHNNLTLNLINQQVFKYIAILDLNGQISHIQSDLFKSFYNLKLLRFRLEYVRNIFSVNNKWLELLNFNRDDVNLNENLAFDPKLSLIFIIYQTWQNFTFYDYPDEDFCLFSKFPHRKFVLPVLKHTRKSSCSCSELYLIQYSYKYSFEMMSLINSGVISNYYQYNYYNLMMRRSSFVSKCINDSIERIIQNCNFEKKLKICKIQNSEAKIKFYFYINDWYMLSKYSKFYLSLYLSPIFSLLAILINLLVLKILSNEIFPKDSERLYRYLKINSYLNIVYILIASFRLMNNCYSEDLFCSSIHDSIYVKYYNIIFIKLIGNTLQTVSNICHVAFTLSRYITIKPTNIKLLVLFNKLTIKMFLFVSFSFSVMINLYVIFEFNLIDRTNSFANRETYLIQDFTAYKKNFTNFEYKLLTILQYFKIAVSDISYIFISLTIDCILVAYIRKKIAIKKRLTGVNLALSLIIQPMVRQSDSVNKKEPNKNKTITSSKRLTGMIILNGLNFLALKFPLSFVNLYGLIFYYDLNSLNNNVLFRPNVAYYLICRIFHFCDSLDEFFYLFYLLSFLIQFLIFQKYDTNFKLSLKKIFKKK